jgi:hypothetical protein
VQWEHERRELLEQEGRPWGLEAEAAAGTASAGEVLGNRGSLAVAAVDEAAEASAASGGSEEPGDCTHVPEDQAPDPEVVASGNREDHAVAAAEVAATSPEEDR